MTEAVFLALTMVLAVPGSIALAEGTKTSSVVTINEDEVPLSARMPDATGTVTYSGGGATIDASNTSNGYLMVKYTGSNQKIKVQITKGTTYTYDLNARNAFEVYPLTEGNGSYSIKVFENVSGNQYAQLLSQTISVSLSNEFAPFLYPNQYVNFNSGSAAVGVAAQLAAGKDPIGVVDAVYKYVIANVSYDYGKAQTVQSGYLPNIDSTLASRTGICFDYAALMTGMLRSQDIPTKLVIGYTGNLYHAWVSVYIAGEGWIDNIIHFDGQKWSYMDPTFMSTGGEGAKQYVGTGSNYQEKYSY
ncbi:MAG: transglutaminase domain-containing protein [Lachnospiraceae bacterium]|nr:transglutaminase domain-containing protein [Lachnospiraceae bacterium]MCI9282925.1 transglutaminase domain-containing protein [Lachnospiraceae bacterium]